MSGEWWEQIKITPRHCAAGGDHRELPTPSGTRPQRKQQIEVKHETN